MQSLKKIFSLLLKHLAPVGLFVILPLLTALYLGQNIIILEKNKQVSELSTQIENSLKDIESEIAPESFLLKIGKGAWFTFKQNENNLNEYWNYYNKLCSFLETHPDMYVFNEKGKLVTPDNINLKSRFLAKKLWDTIEDTYENRSDCALKYKKQFKSFLGNEFKLGNFLDSRNRLMPIIVNCQDGFVYWMNFPNNPKKGIMLVFWNIPELRIRLQKIIKTYSSKFDNGFIKDSDDSIKAFDERFSTNNIPNYYDQIFNKTALIESNDGFIDSKGLVWKYISIKDIFLIAGLKSNSLKYDVYHNIYIITLLIIAILIVMTYYWSVKQENSYISIRIKLIALFLIAVFTPVMAFSYLGYQYISDMNNNIRTQVLNESRDVLLNIDRELGGSGNVFREDFRKIVKDFQHYDEDENIRKSIHDQLARHDLVAIDRKIASDASVIKSITNFVVFDGIEAVTDPFAKCCIDTMLNTNLMDSLDPVLAQALNSPECGLTSFSARPDNVQNFSFGSLEFYLYWCFAQSEKYGREFFLVVRMTDYVLREHLRIRLEKSKNIPKEKNFIIAVRNDRNGEWFPNHSFEKTLKTFSRRVNSMGKPIETDIVMNSEHYLLLGLKSSNLRGYSLYAFYPYEKIDNKVTKVIRIIVASIILFIIIALAIGYVLSETFLYPVNRLEDGVKAIKERNSKFRIEKLQNDEFGDLALNFNKMISDLKEMQLAKYIQESLLPQSLPQLDGYEICFSNRMASAVGGDYFDTMLLDKDNLCIIIGDVSGHGVASALVMAIAKAILYHGFKETRNLLELFSDLNSVINTYFNKPPVKKMITLFATIINLPTGKAIFTDAGHNFPMKIDSNGEVTELKMLGLPVGVMKKMRKQKTDEFIINEGETVVFYTDGIVEATGLTTEQYGYDRFKKHLSEIANDNSENILNKLFEKYELWEAGTEPDDDVTLIVLKRLSSQDNKGNIIC